MRILHKLIAWTLIRKFSAWVLLTDCCIMTSFVAFNDTINYCQHYGSYIYCLYIYWLLSFSELSRNDGSQHVLGRYRCDPAVGEQDSGRRARCLRRVGDLHQYLVVESVGLENSWDSRQNWCKVEIYLGAHDGVCVSTVISTLSRVAIVSKALPLTFDLLILLWRKRQEQKVFLSIFCFPAAAFLQCRYTCLIASVLQVLDSVSRINDFTFLALCCAV